MQHRITLYIEANTDPKDWLPMTIFEKLEDREKEGHEDEDLLEWDMDSISEDED